MEPLREQIYQLLLDALSTPEGVSTHEDAVYQTITDRMADGLGLPCVWIGWAHPGQQDVQVRAASGPAVAFAWALRLSLQDAFFEKGQTTDGAPHTGSQVRFQGFSKGPLATWRGLASKHGLEGSAHTLFYGPAGGVGVLALHWGHGAGFPGGIGALLDGVRSDLEQFLERSAPVRQLSRINHYQAAAIAAQQELLRLQTPREMFQRLVEIVVEQTDLLAAFVATPQDGSPWLQVIAASAKNKELQQALYRLTPSRDPGNFPHGRMVCSRSFQTNSPCISQAFHSDAALQAVIAEEPTLGQVAASMGWPLLAGEDGVPSAVLTVEATDPQHFTNDLRQLLQQLSDGLNLALAQHRLRESERRLQRYQEAALAAQQELLVLKDPLEMLRHLAEIIVEKTDAIACHVVMPVEGTPDLHVVAASARDHAVQETLLRLRFPKTPPEFATEETVAGRSFQEKGPTGPVSTETPWLRAFLDKGPALQAIRALMGWPILLEGEEVPYAVLVVDVEDAGHFTDALQQLLRQLTHSFSAAMGRRRQEEALERLFRAIDLLPHNVYIKDREGRFLYANESVARFMGADTPKALLGRSDFDFYPNEMATKFFQDELRVVRTGGPMVGEAEHIQDALGQEHWLLTTKVPLRERDGAIVGTIGIGHDITLQKKAEMEAARAMAALRQSEEKFHRLFMDAPVPLAYTNKQGDILDVNRSFVDVFGYSHAEVPTLAAWGKRAYPDPEYRRQVRDNWKANVARSLETGNDVQPVEHIVTGKNGARHIVLIGGIAIGDNFLSTFVDITERHAQEQANRLLSAKLQTLFATTTAGIDVVRYPERVFTEVNQAFLDILGIGSREEILGHSTSEIFADKVQGERTAEAAERAIREGRASLRDLEVVRWDGRRAFVDVYAQRLDGEGPAHPLVVWTSVDVTERKQQEDALRKLSLAVEQNPSSIVITDLEGNIEYVNDAFCNTTGYTQEEVLGKNPRILQSGKVAREVYVAMWETLLRGETWRGEFINRAKDGREYIEQALISPVRQAGGKITHYLAIKEDITQRKQQEEALRESEERWKFALEGSEAGVFDWNVPDDIVTYSEQWEKILGHAKHELAPHAHEVFASIHREDVDQVREAVRSCLRGSTPSFAAEFRMLCKDGRWKWVMGRGMVVRRGLDHAPLRFIGTITDISLRKAAEEEVRHMAFHDALTGLPNRVALEDHLDKAMARAQRHKKLLAVCLLDLDDFKPVNDVHGHAAGDLLLRSLAERLRSCVRRSDFIARLGGDEFVLLVEDLESEKDIHPVMDNVQQAIAMPFVLSSQVTVGVGASIGVCLYGPSRSSDEGTGDMLLRRADLALYQNKEHKTGRDRRWEIYVPALSKGKNAAPSRS